MTNEEIEETETPDQPGCDRCGTDGADHVLDPKSQAKLLWLCPACQASL